MDFNKNNYFIENFTFRFNTPHLEKSRIFKLYAIPSGSLRSGRIVQARSASGFTARSSANKGDPLKPTGFFSRAVIISDVLAPCDENEHCISLTVKIKLAINGIIRYESLTMTIFLPS